MRLRKDWTGPFYNTHCIIPYDKGLISVIRSIPGRRWESTVKRWFLPATQKNADMLLTALNETGRFASPSAGKSRAEKLDPQYYSFMDLLLLGDEQENMIKKYIYIGDLFALYDNDLKTVSVVTNEDTETYEIKNLATYEKYHGKGYGSHMLKYIIEGFVYSHTIKNFFVDNYDHEMFEDDKQLVDMIYLKLEYEK